MRHRRTCYPGSDRQAGGPGDPSLSFFQPQTIIKRTKGTRLEDSGSVAKLLWPALLAIAQPAREKRRLEPNARDQLILALCARTSLSVRELSQLLDRTEAYVGDAIRPLVDAQRLTFLYPDQPRHPRQRYLTAGSEADAEAAGARITSHAPDKISETAKESPASLVWTELERIALPARDKRRLPPPIRDDLVVALCGRAPLSVRELAALLNRSEAYVSDAIQPLVAAGRLSFLFPDQPRHPKQRYVARWIEPPSTDFEDEMTGEAEDARFIPAASPETPDVAEPVPEPAAKAPPQYVPPVVRSEPPVRSVPRPAPPPATTEPNVTRTSAEPTAARGYSILNAQTSWVLAAVVGAVLGMLQPSGWPLYALIVSAGIALLHVMTESGQYQRYRGLNSTRASTTTFILLKAVFAMVEITILYYVTAAIFG